MISGSRVIEGKESDSDGEVFRQKAPVKRKAFIESESEDDTNEDEGRGKYTPVQHSTPFEKSQGSRSSSRLQSKQQRVFQMPDRKSVFDQIESPEHNVSLSLSEFKPRKLVNNFMKETNRYNYDPAYTSGESSGMEDFLDDNFDYVDESSYLSEDSNISSDPERSQIKDKKKTTKRKRKTSNKKKTVKKRKQLAPKDDNGRTRFRKTDKDVNENECGKTRRNSKSKPAKNSSSSDETSDYSYYSCDENEENVNTKRLHRSIRLSRTIYSDTESEDGVPESRLPNRTEPTASTSRQRDESSIDSDVPLSQLKSRLAAKASTSQQQEVTSEGSDETPWKRRKRDTSRVHSSGEDSCSGAAGNDGDSGEGSDPDVGELSKSILEKVSERSKVMADKKSERRHSFDELRKKRLRRLSRP